ncbi:hypothetical protein HALLA_13790 [Halostagnicola larsenii XH-48]|uniref:Uncharacterized protein n=1 Tax=Halostagnicola larsenii XH-48 TaxID=797299 RepID=W0JQY8_9EURY|nr:DUF6735 family protein [Halostagnicola larsenii]AHF99696.1 hypothetical protein HALLA_13790 [Halostagnicola larsenii XH-48]
MGHRALVAYRRPDHLFDLRYSHWGAANLELADRIDADSPLGSGTVDSDVLADSVALDRVLTNYLDPCTHEALYLVSTDFDIRSYRVCWLEWGDGREQGRGAIVEIGPDTSDRELSIWFRATKTVLADVIEMGALSRRAAQTYLEARVAEDKDGHVYTYRGTDATGEEEYVPTPDQWIDEEEW